MPLRVIQQYSDWVCTAVMSNDVVKDLAFVLYSASSFGDRLTKLSFWSVIQTYTGKTGNKINTTNTTAAQRYQSNPSAL